MPGALTVLYVIAIVGAVISLVMLFYVGGSPVLIGYLIGASVGLFIPALVTHAIIAAIYDLRWKRSDTLL